MSDSKFHIVGALMQKAFINTASNIHVTVNKLLSEQ